MIPTPTTCRGRLFALLTLGVLMTTVVSMASGAVEFEVTPQSEVAVIGQDLVLELKLTVPAGDRLLADGIAVTIDTGQDADTIGKAYPLEPLSAPVGGSNPVAYEGQVLFEWAAPISADATPVDLPVILTVTHTIVGQAATESQWQGQLAVDFGEEWSANKITDFIDKKGLGLFLLMVFGFGLLMSLSPCIYPMIPITLAVIGVQSKEKGVAHGLLLSTTYVAGMALVYAIIGIIVATVFSGLTAYMQSPVVVGPIALLLLVLSFGMFGAFELQAPQFLRDKLQGPGGSSRSGLIGIFLMGMVAGLIASPCVGPFLNALLLVIATTGDAVLGFVSLFIFGIGMGMLLIGVGTFPALLSNLPQAGGWMENVNKGMGLLLVAMAFYFVRPGIFIPEPIFYPLVGATMIIIAVFMGAFDGLADRPGWWPRALKGLGLITLVAGLYLLAGSFITNGFIMPSPLTSMQTQQVQNAPESYATQDLERAAIVESPITGSNEPQPLPKKVQWTKIHTGENVQAFLDEQAATAKAAGQPMMIDFWATWCVYCKKLDKQVWNVPDVVRESQRFVTIKIDATATDDDEMTAIKAAWDVGGLPRVVFIDSRGDYLPGRSTGFEPPEKMLEIMKSIR